MKNILYIGPYKENTGLGRAARRYVDALGYNMNINLTIRPIYFTPNLDYGNESGKDYVEFEDNTSKNYDMVIQHGYANCFEYREQFGKNIGIPDIDTYNIGHTTWAERCNMMDRIIVPSVWSRQSLLDANCETEIDIIPEPFDLNKFDKNYEPIFENENNDFIFYYIGKHQDKNNIKAILAAFFLEFKQHDDVRLIIKTEKLGFDNQEAQHILAFDIQEVEKSLRINSKHVVRPHVLVGYYEQEYIYRLHKQSNCFINAAKCESFGASAIESMLFNNLTITNKGIGSNTYINDKNGFEIESMMNNVYSKDFYMENTYTIYEQWREPFLESLRIQMRKAYETNEKQKEEKLSHFDKQPFGEESFVRELIK